MIKSEKYKDDLGVIHSDLIKTYSTEGLPIKQSLGGVYTGRIYNDGVAIDKLPSSYEYIEKTEEEEAEQIRTEQEKEN